MADLCVLCRIDPATERIGEHSLCRDCADDYPTFLED